MIKAASEAEGRGFDSRRAHHLLYYPTPSSLHSLCYQYQ